MDRNIKQKERGKGQEESRVMMGETANGRKRMVKERESRYSSDKLLSSGALSQQAHLMRTTHKHTHANKHTNTHTHTHTHFRPTNTPTHAYIHTYIHAHTHSDS